MTSKSPFLPVLCCGLALLAAGCKKDEPAPAAAAPEFAWQIDQFADLRVLRYQVPGFEALTAHQNIYKPTCKTSLDSRLGQYMPATIPRQMHSHFF